MTVITKRSFHDAAHPPEANNMGIGDHQGRWSQPQSVIVLQVEDRRPWCLGSETSLSPIFGD